MKNRDARLYAKLDLALRTHSNQVRPLPGVDDPQTRECLVRQLVDSSRRVGFVRAVLERDVSPLRANPASNMFDPVRAAILSIRTGDIEEAFWLVFLFVHFGKHSEYGYSYARAVYGRLDQDPIWRWDVITADVHSFCSWVAANETAIRAIPGGFGNHRKYESVGAIGRVIASYVEWVESAGSHAELCASAVRAAADSPTSAFQALFHSMDAVLRFGRTARFDYLAMVGKLGLYPIAPGSAFLLGATGPVRGARILYGVDQVDTGELDQWLVELGRDLNQGLQEIEDAICNWQKSPTAYYRFRG